MPCSDPQCYHKPWPENGKHQLRIESCERQCGWSECGYEAGTASNLRKHVQKHIANEDRLRDVIIIASKAGRPKVGSRSRSAAVLHASLERPPDVGTSLGSRSPNQRRPEPHEAYMYPDDTHEVILDSDEQDNVEIIMARPESSLSPHPAVTTRGLKTTNAHDSTIYREQRQTRKFENSIGCARCRVDRMLCMPRYQNNSSRCDNCIRYGHPCSTSERPKIASRDKASEQISDLMWERDDWRARVEFLEAILEELNNEREEDKRPDILQTSSADRDTVERAVPGFQNSLSRSFSPRVLEHSTNLNISTYSTYSAPSSSMDQTMAAHLSMKQALMDQGTDVPDYSSQRPEASAIVTSDTSARTSHLIASANMAANQVKKSSLRDDCDDVRGPRPPPWSPNEVPAAQAWDLIQSHPLVKQGFVDIVSVCERLGGKMKHNGLDPVLEESAIWQAVEESRRRD